MSALRFPFRSINASLTKHAIEEDGSLESHLQVLKQSGMFFQLTHTQLEMIAEICQEKVFQINEVIFLEGYESDEIYVIIQGEVDILCDTSLLIVNNFYSPTEAPISKLRRGQSFGEIALVDRGFRTATARTSQNNTRLLVIPCGELLEICENFPQLGYKLMKNIAAELALKLCNRNLGIYEQLPEPQKY